MKVVFTISLLLIFSSGMIFSQNTGETKFKQDCAACHTVGNGRLVGPDLINIEQRQKRDWLQKWIKSSQTLVKSGDSYANQIFAEYNQMIMPDVMLSDNEINAVLDYIAATSSSISSAAAETAQASSTAIAGNAENGKNLFVGNVRLTHGGPTCNSCHNINRAGVMTGGVMAKDLTDLPQRMDTAGVKATIVGMLAGIPAMKQSFGNHPLTDTEIADIAAFLATPHEAPTGIASDEAALMMWGGLAGAGVLVLLLFPLFWIRRKRRAVNQAIYRRQIKSLY